MVPSEKKNVACPPEKAMVPQGNKDVVSSRQYDPLSEKYYGVN